MTSKIDAAFRLTSHFDALELCSANHKWSGKPHERIGFSTRTPSIMSTTFATPAVGGFHKRGRHPDGGHYYGGAETALCELVRGGDMVLREVMYHDDDVRDSVACPIMIEQLRVRDVRSRVAVRGRYLLNGAKRASERAMRRRLCL